MKRGSKVSFFILCYGGFLDWMSYGFVFPIFAAMIYDQGTALFAFDPYASRGVWLGVLIAASPLAQFMSAPFIGALSDRTGRKPMLQITSLLMAAGYLIAAFGVWELNLFLLILGRVVTGLGAGNIAVINSATSDISEPRVKAKKFAMIAMANGIGFAVGPLIGGKLAVWGYDIPFLCSGLLTVVNFFLLTFLFAETRVKVTTAIVSFAPRLFSLIKIADFRKFAILFPAFFIFCLGWSFYWEFIPVTWIKSYRLNVSQIGEFYAYGSAFYVLSSGLLIRPIVKKFSGLLILFISLGGLGAFLAALIHSKVEMYWYCIPVQQFLVAMIFPVGTAIVSNMASEDEQGQTLGGFQSLQSFAFAVTPFLGGMVLDYSHEAPLIVSCIAMFVACLVLLFGFRKKLFVRS